jgi:hypothetical protein
MKRPSNSVVAVGLIVLVIGGGLYVLLHQRPSLADAVEPYEFVVLTPPSTLYAPGTIVAIRKNKPLVFDLVCTQSSSLGGDVQLATSPTMNSEMVNKISKAFDFDAVYPGLLEAKTEFKAVRRVNVRLSNVSVSELSADELYAKVVNRSQRCIGAMAQYVQKGRELSVISATLRADVTYEVALDEDATLTARDTQRVVSTLATNLGVSYKADRGQIISATGLDLGVRDNGWWATLKRDRTLVATAIADPRLLEVHKEISDSLMRIAPNSRVSTIATATAIAVMRDTAQASRPIADRAQYAIPVRK